MNKWFIALFLVVLWIPSLIAQSTTDLEIIKVYLSKDGFSNEDIEGLRIDKSFFSKSLQATTVYVNQYFNGIRINDAVATIAIKNNKVVSFKGNLIQDIAGKVSGTIPQMTAENAILNVAHTLKLGAVKQMKLLSTDQKKSSTHAKSYVFSKSNISLDDIPVSLVYELQNDKLVLCWDMSIHTVDGKDWYSARMNADSGQLVSMNNWITHCSFETTGVAKKEITEFSLFKTQEKSVSSFMKPAYNVFPVPGIESPNHGSRQLVSGQEDAIASPYGWHDTDGIVGPEFTNTSGNNVFAYEDISGTNRVGEQPDGGAALLFDFPYDPDAVVKGSQFASITNLFYVSNVVHDISYHYGFDEAAGNFQANNYLRGGRGGDQLRAETLDGSGVNNANFGSPPDGSNPRMQMFLWNPRPDPSVEIFVVNNSALAGSYTIIDNSFDQGHVDAPEFPEGLSGDLVLIVDNDPSDDPNNGCTEFINAAQINGNIAVVRRGVCNFTDKVFRSQQAGAIAVLVVNNQAGSSISMSGEDARITIPAVMIGMADGEALINAMNTSVINVTLSDAGLNVFAADSSFDNGIVIHEYAHGISIRLTGGANNSNCLNICGSRDSQGNCIQDTEQMGEGWSDWFALMMTMKAEDTGSKSRGISTFASGQPITGRGIRPFPYSTDMSINPVTYVSTNDETRFSAPHGVGSIWASMLWDLTWALIQRDGFDPDLYTGKGGNNLAMQLVMDGLKLQSCNPGFVDARDGILEADKIANNGANSCLIWDVFARRGLGWSANQGDSQSRTDQVEAFDTPPSSELNCEQLGVADNNLGVFTIAPNPSSGTFAIKVSKYIGPTILSIFDLNGRLVHKENALLENSYNIKTELRQGLYILKIEAKNGAATTSAKIIIK